MPQHPSTGIARSSRRPSARIDFPSRQFFKADHLEYPESQQGPRMLGQHRGRSAAEPSGAIKRLLDGTIRDFDAPATAVDLCSLGSCQLGRLQHVRDQIDFLMSTLQTQQAQHARGRRRLGFGAETNTCALLPNVSLNLLGQQRDVSSHSQQEVDPLSRQLPAQLITDEAGIGCDEASRREACGHAFQMATLTVCSRSTTEIPNRIRSQMEQCGVKDLRSGAVLTRTPQPLFIGLCARGLKAGTIGCKDDPAGDPPSMSGKPSHAGLQRRPYPADQQTNFASQGGGVSGVRGRCLPSREDSPQEFAHMLKAAGQSLSLMPTHQKTTGQQLLRRPPGIAVRRHRFGKPRRMGQIRNRVSELYCISYADWPPCHVRVSCWVLSVVTQSLTETRTSSKTNRAA